MNSITLEQDFATKHPAAFARVVSTLSISDSLPIFRSLPPQVIIPVLNFISGPHLLAIATDLISPEVLSASALDRSLPVLMRLPKEVSRDLVNSIPDTALRAKYRRELRHPTGSIAAVVQPASIILDAQTRVSELAELIGQSSEEPTILVCGDDGRYLGVVPTWQCIGKTNTVLNQVARYVLPLQAASLVANARRHPFWNRRAWFPVTDGDRHPIGVLWRDRLEQYAEDDVSAWENMSDQFFPSLFASLSRITETLAREGSR